MKDQYEIVLEFQCLFVRITLLCEGACTTRDFHWILIVTFFFIEKSLEQLHPNKFRNKISWRVRRDPPTPAGYVSRETPTAIALGHGLHLRVSLLTLAILMLLFFTYLSLKSLHSPSLQPSTSTADTVQVSRPQV